jgi:hypothetical protein
MLNFKNLTRQKAAVLAVKALDPDANDWIRLAAASTDQAKAPRPGWIMPPPPRIWNQGKATT